MDCVRYTWRKCERKGGARSSPAGTSIGPLGEVLIQALSESTRVTRAVRGCLETRIDSDVWEARVRFLAWSRAPLEHYCPPWSPSRAHSQQDDV